MNKKPFALKHVFLKTCKENIRITVVLICTIAGAVIFSLLPPLILGKAIDALNDHGSLTMKLALLYFLFIALSSISEAAKEAAITIFGQKLTHVLRSEMSQKLYYLKASYYTDQNAGGLSSLFVNDVDTVETLFSDGIISMFSDLFSVISILIVIFTKSTGLGTLILIVLPLLFLLTRVYQKRMFSAQIDNRKAVAAENGQLPETIHNIRAIHVFHGEDFMEQKYQKAIDKSYKAMEKSNFCDASYSPIIITVSAIVTGVMMSLAGAGEPFLTYFGMSAGTAAAIISYVGNIFTPLESIGMEIQSIQTAAAGIARIKEFMQEEEREIVSKPVTDNKTDALDIEHMSFGYDENSPVLKDFHLSVHTGETITFTGRTGCGKSTLFRLIMGLYEPDKGTVSIYGTKASQITDTERRHIFGYVEQSYVPVCGTIRDQITLYDHSISDEDIWKALELTGLKEEIKDLPGKLDTEYQDSLFSQGQQQLLSITRAVVCNPKILLLDETTANLDAKTEAEVMKALMDASKGRTVLSISHRLYENKKGRIIYMQS